MILKKILHKSKLFLLKMLQDAHYPSEEQQIQKNLLSQWIFAKKQNIQLYDDVKDAGFRCYSQFEEDGIILYLLSIVGFGNRTVVEMCSGTGNECMAANLIINHGFKGFLFDGDKSNISIAKEFFARNKDCLLVGPEINQAWITKDNVNKLLLNSGIKGEVSLFSLDMDGVDYYIWEAIEVISPRICVFETHNIVPTDLSLTIPYSDNFFAFNKVGAEQDFRSASLLAMDKLSKEKGYTLVGSHRHGFNVFYVRNDLLNDLLPRPNLDDIHDNEWTRFSQRERWPLAKDFPWINI